MSTVALTIGPKTYNVACAEGQEARITVLGAMIAEKYAQLGASRAPLEAQNLLFAALFLADELTEARKRGVPTPDTAPAPALDPQVVEALRAAIAELENDLAAARAAAASDLLPPQASIPSDGGLAETLADQLDALAAHAEASADALEAAAANAYIENGGTARHEPIEHP